MIKFKGYSFLIIIVLIISIFPNVGSVYNNESILVSKINIDSVVDDLQGVIVLCIIEIENVGDTTLRAIDWTFNARAENGKIVFGDGEHGRIPVLEPGEKERIILVPFPNLISIANGQSPIGFGKISMISTAETSTGASAEDQETVFLFGPFMFPIL
jgi:hypothetical protein